VQKTAPAEPDNRRNKPTVAIAILRAAWRGLPHL